MATGAGPYGARVVQDMPPPGGYAPFRTTALFPKRGPSGPVILVGWLAMTGYGLYLVGQQNHQLEYAPASRRAAPPHAPAASGLGSARRRSAICCRCCRPSRTGGTSGSGK